MVELWHMFFANKAAILGLVLWLLVVLTAVFGLTIHPVTLMKWSEPR